MTLRIEAEANEREPQNPQSPQDDVEEDGTKKKKKKNKRTREQMTSALWKHFRQTEEGEDVFYDAICIYYEAKYKMGKSRGTGSMKHHFNHSCKKNPIRKRQKVDALQKLLKAGSATAPSLVAWEFDQMRSRKELARMVIAHDYSFNCVNHHFLKEFLRELQPSFKMITRNTLRQDCLNVYAEEQAVLYDVFEKLDCRFSFTSDLWTNKGRDRGFMALTCHYIDEKWQLRKMVIAFAPLETPHTGVAIADAIFERLVLWNLDKKILCLVLDGSSANDACIKEILSDPSIKASLPVDGGIFHQRCGCHILNLVVQDGLALLGKEIDCIRDTIKYIRHSQARMQMYSLGVSQVKASKRKPIWDVATRWNSTYKMLNVAVELKDTLIRFATLDKKFTLKPNEIDWDKMNALLDCLKIFYEVTLKLSGTKYPTLNLFFPEFCEVHLSIKNMSHSTYPFIVKMGKGMTVKWNKYWSSESMLLAVPCVLDPRSKLLVVEYYIKQMYTEEEKDTFMLNLNKCILALFNDYVKANSSRAENQSHPVRQTPTTSSHVVSDTRAALKDFIKGKKTAEPKKTELEEYLADPLDEACVDADFDILSWWRLKSPKYHLLAKLVKDILAVPISTVASECTFSISGRTLSPVRSSLNDESIEALICAQDWLRASVNESGGIFGDVLWSTDEMAADDGSCASSA